MWIYRDADELNIQAPTNVPNLYHVTQHTREVGVGAAWVEPLRSADEVPLRRHRRLFVRDKIQIPVSFVDKGLPMKMGWLCQLLSSVIVSSDLREQNCLNLKLMQLRLQLGLFHFCTSTSSMLM